MAIQEKTFSTGDYAWKSWSNGYVISLTLTEESIDTINNTSLVSYLFTISNTDNNRFISSNYSWNISIGDKTISISGLSFNLSSNYTTQTIASGQVTVAHNADGKRDMPYSVSIPNVQAYTSYGPPAMSLAGTWTLTAIPRWATLTGCPSEFSDENNPQIAYSNPAGNAISELYGVLAINGGTQNIAVREIPKTESRYTFVLTAAERSALWNACPTSNTLTVTFYVQSTIGAESKRVYKNSTLRIVNANPTLSPTVTEANDVMYALTGDRNKLVRFHSNAAVTIGATAKKGASIQQKNAQNGGQYLLSDGTFYAVESGTFSFAAHDTRLNEAEVVKINKTLIPYVKLSCSIASATLDTNGIATVMVNGNCFSGSFGSVANSLSLQYQWKTQGGTYGEWQNVSHSGLAGDKYSASFSVTGLDYRQSYVFRVKVTDEIETVTTGERVVSGKPVFDWGKSDFRLNVPTLYMASDTGTSDICFTNSTGALQAAFMATSGRMYLRSYCTDTSYYEQYRTPGLSTELTDNKTYDLLTTRTVKDFVIAQGTSGSWKYRKWNSGIAECWISVRSSGGPDSLGNAGNIYAMVYSRFPFDFASAPTVIASGWVNSENYKCPTDGSKSSATYGIVHMVTKDFSGAQAVGGSAYFIGTLA